MRTFLAVIAAGVLAYCLHALLSMPVTAGTTLDVIIAGLKGQDRQIVVYVGAGALSALMLLLLALRKTRIIVEERKLDHIRRFIDETSPWLKRREKARAEASGLLVELGAIGQRLDSLQAPSTGLSSQLGTIASQVRVAEGRIEDMTMDGDKDIALEISSARASLDHVGERLTLLETGISQMPGMVIAAEDITRRVAALNVDREALIENLGQLLKKVYELIEAGGTLSELEAGHGDWEGDFGEQVKGLQDDAKDIVERLVAIEKSAAMLPILELGVGDLEERVKPLADEDTGLVAELTQINERLQALINDDDGTLKTLEAGNPNDENNDNVADQIVQIQKDVDSIIERIEKLKLQQGELGGIMRDLAKFTETAVGPVIASDSHVASDAASQRQA